MKWRPFFGEEVTLLKKSILSCYLYVNMFLLKYFTNLDCIHAYDTRSKQKSKYFLPRYQTNYGKKSLQYFGIKLWLKIPQKIKCLSYISFKNVYKNYLFDSYKLANA